MHDQDLATRPASICAVVLTFNRRALVTQCLTALSSQTRPLDEVIVVDNAGTDGTEAAIRTEFHHVTYVRLPENMGSAGGFYEGMKLAYEKGHDWMWVMDDDVMPMADALERLVGSPAMLRDNVYALSSITLHPDGSLYLLNCWLVDFRTMKERPVDASKYVDDYFEMDAGPWSGLLVSRRAVKDVGLPLKDLFIFHDDYEYTVRMRRKGTLLTVPASRVVHFSVPSYTGKPVLGMQPSNWKNYYYARNYIYTRRKYGRPGLYFYFIVLRGLVYGVAQTLLFREYRFQSFRIRLCGTLDGLRAKLGENTHFLPR